MDALLQSLFNQPVGKAATDMITRLLSYARISRQYYSPLAACLAFSYVLLCRSLRYKRVNSLRRRMGYVDEKSMEGMTNVDAQAIVKSMAELEFPILFRYSLNFALFKTYGVPTISSLLVATRMFSTQENASKRYEDTTVLIGEFLSHDPREKRTAEAIARMNYLHGPYIKSGKISNNDLLYTLSVFITEPISWIDRFEWRKTTALEVCALSTFWKSVGDAMSIDYSDLKNDSWNNGIDFYYDIKEWAQRYEADVMRPCQSNRTTADELVPLLLHYVPHPLMGFARQVVGVLMGERLLWAMSYPEPSLGGYNATYCAIAVRRFILRHLTLPRLHNKTEFTPKDPKTGRYYHESYLVHPYYVKPTLFNRWGPTACMTRLLGGIVPGGKEGKKYYPNGYIMVEVGPDKKRGQGEDDLQVSSETIKEARSSKCPFIVN